MRFKWKIALATLAAAAAPLLLAALAWAGYMIAHGEFPGGEADAASPDTLCDVLYVFEDEVARIDWSGLVDAEAPGQDYIPADAQSAVGELADMGYRIEVAASDGSRLFSNLGPADEAAMASAGDGVSHDSLIVRDGGIVVVRDSFSRGGEQYSVNAVYDPSRADSGVAESTVRVELLPQGTVFALLAVVVIGGIAVCLLLVWWIGDSVSRPLSLLASGAKAVAAGDLDTPVGYDAPDEFGEVCAEFDRMRLGLKAAAESRAQAERQRRDLAAGGVIVAGDLVVYEYARRVTMAGEEVRLANREFELLAFMASNPGIVFSKERLFERVWGMDAVGDLATVAVHVNRIREKVEPDPAHPSYIHTVRGAGYRFDAPEL